MKSIFIFTIDELKKKILLNLIKIGLRKKKKLKSMISEIVGSYRNSLQYHNIYHAYDVCENMMFIDKTVDKTIRKTEFYKSISRLAYFGALCRDICHLGFDDVKRKQIVENTDTVSINTTKSIAHINFVLNIFLRYVDCFCLKDVHINYARTFLKNIILSSYSSLNNENYNNIKNLKITQKTIKEYPIAYYSLFIKVSELSYFCKKFHIHCDWVLRFVEEKQTNYTCLSHIAQNTIFFIKRLKQLFVVFDYVLDLEGDRSFSEQLNDNQTIWYTYIDNNNQSECTYHRSLIDTLSTSVSITDYIFTTHENICICMIDITNFSQWCSKQKPKDIFKTMTEFNLFLNKRISKYSNVEKIELVGDSVMIVGGLYQNCDVSEYTQNVLELCYDILVDVHEIKDLFKDDMISVRIGVHNGDVYGGYIYNPKKYQLFGNSINVASRLESRSLPGVLNMSVKTFEIIKESDVLSKFDIGKTNSTSLKGIGVFDSKWCFIYMNNVLIADDVLTTCHVIKNALKYVLNNEKTCLIETNEIRFFKLIRQFKYSCVFLDRHFDNNDILLELKEFRIWETKYCSSSQKIYMITSLEEDNKNNIDYLRLYVDDVIDKDVNFLSKIKHIFI
jgi:class 3 adenylate cyclase